MEMNLILNLGRLIFALQKCSEMGNFIMVFTFGLS